MRVEMKKWYVVASLLVVMLLVTGCAVTRPAPAPALNPPPELAIIKQSISMSDTGAEVTVTVKNLGPPMAEFAEVTVEFYDADGNLITTSSDAVMNLKRGETWKFTISCTGVGCDRVKTYEVTATAASSYKGY